MRAKSIIVGVSVLVLMVLGITYCKGQSGPPIRDTIIEYTDSNATIFQFNSTVKSWGDMEVFTRDTFPCIFMVSQYANRRGADAKMMQMEGYVEVWFEKIVYYRGDDFWFRQAHGPFQQLTRFYLKNMLPVNNTPLVIWDEYIFNWIDAMPTNYKYDPELVKKMDNIYPIDDSWKNNLEYLRDFKKIADVKIQPKG